MQNSVTRAATSFWPIVFPLALAQFVCSYAATTMNVSISSIATDLGTDVYAIQKTITFFTLTMAALMIPGSKLSDIWGRKFCLMLGLTVYGLGALIATFAQSIGVLTFGYSLLEGVGTALLIPPVYILCTVSFLDLPTRARAFGVISAAGGIGAAAGPLIGGILTTAISWRASFTLQVLIVLVIIVLSRRIDDPGVQGARPKFDFIGTILSAAGLFFVVLGILQAGTYGWVTASQNFTIGTTVVIPQGGISPVWLFVGIGALLLVGFFFWIRSRERAGKEPLLSTHLFRNRTSNLGLVTQLIQWFILQGSFFVISVFLQEVRGYNAIQTGLALTPTTIGILITGGIAGRLAQKVYAKNPHLGRLCLNHRRHDPAVALRASHLKQPRLHSGPSVDRSGSGSDADLLGQRRAVQLSRQRPGGDLRLIALRFESGVLAWDCHCRLGVGHDTRPARQDLCPGPHYDDRLCMHWPDRSTPASLQSGAIWDSYKNQ